jgi:hypothetical protein
LRPEVQLAIFGQPDLNSMWKTNFSRFSQSGLVLLFLCSCARADLVICVHRQDNLFVAGDTLSTSAGTDVSSSGRRIFKLEDACCVTITGFIEPLLKDTKSGKAATIFFPGELEQICEETRRLDEPLADKISQTVTRFGERYHDCLQHRAKSKKAPAPDAGEIKTRITFLGYDSASKKFFGRAYRFSETNRTVLESVFESNGTNDPAGLSFVGETGFPRALLAGEQRVAQLPSDDFRDAIKDLYSGAPVTDGRIIKCLLEMFRLQKENSARLGYDRGTIGEPYTIYKITREEIVQVH